MTVPKNDAEAIKTKTQILDAAEWLFAAKGFAAIGLEEIARRAKVTQPLIYHYFDAKPDILRALYDRFEEALSALKKRFEKANRNEGEEAHRVTLEETYSFLEKWKRMIKICLAEEINYLEKGPLFELLEKKEGAASVEAETITFFAAIFPCIGYALMADEWSAHMGISKSRIREALTPYILSALKNTEEG